MTEAKLCSHSFFRDRQRMWLARPPVDLHGYTESTSLVERQQDQTQPASMAITMTSLQRSAHYLSWWNPWSVELHYVKVQDINILALFQNMKKKCPPTPPQQWCLKSWLVFIHKILIFISKLFLWFNDLSHREWDSCLWHSLPGWPGARYVTWVACPAAWNFHFKVAKLILYLIQMANKANTS